MSIRQTTLQALLVLSGLCSFLPVAHATDYIWVGGDAAHPTSWSAAANWQPNGIPGAVDKAIIGSNITVDVSSDVTVSGLSLETGSTLQGSGMVTVNDNLDAVDATLDGGDLNLASTCDSEFNSVLPPASPSKNNKSKKKVKNKGKVKINSGNLVLGSDFENDLGGTVEIKTDGAITWTGVNNPKFRNQGKLIKSGGAATSTITAPIENTGIVLAQYGNLDLGPSYKQLSGRTLLNGGSLSSNSPITFSGGTLEGTGVINGSVVNSAGRVAPGHSPGSITILGNFTQTTNGTLDMQIAGTAPGTGYDQISVQGNASLAGTLHVSWLNGFQPNVGDSFTLLEYWSSSGSFQTLTGLSPGNHKYLTTSYTPSYFLASTKLDSALPLVSIASPSGSSWRTGQFPVSGTASDKDSGVASVSVRLYRSPSSTLSDGYWNGSTWDKVYDTTRHEIRATGTTSWSLTLPKLPTGRYSFRATATDKVGYMAPVSAGPFSVDNGLPTIAISTPVNGAFVNVLAPFQGSASDDTNGSGLASIQLTLKQVATGKFWTGAAWGNSTNLPASLSGSIWKSAFTLPKGSNLPNGSYQVTAKATDKAGLNKSVSLSFTVDITPPTLTVVTPVNGLVAKDLPSTAGTTSDASSKVKSVTIRLFRYASPLAVAAYWNGTSWDATYAPAKHELVPTGLASWSRVLLPNAASRTDGKYSIQATAKDNAGNSSIVTNTVTLDSKAPQSVTIDTPLPSSIVKTLTRIAGTSTDNAGGQGIARTDLQIRRAQDLSYWNGSAWQLAPAALSTTQSGTSWSRTQSSTTPLPSLSNLANGAYMLTAIAFDKVGNSKAVSSTVTIDQSPPSVQITSPNTNTTYKQLSKIVGTSQDTGSGIAKITLRLYRYATSTAPAGYWNGSSWTTTYSATNELAVSGTTSWSFPLPALAEGNYSCTASATDRASNTTITPACVFNLDSTSPSIAFTRPLGNPAFLKTLTSITGTASDNIALSRVTVCLYRYATTTIPAGYWNGSSWTATYSAANEVITSGIASWSFVPPALPEGRYSITATATDKAGNAAVSPKVLLTLDSTIPAVSITSPLLGSSIVKSLGTVAGKASDVGGLDKVTLRLYRYATATAPEAFWNGTDWTATYSAANEVPVSTTSTWSYALPALIDGRYFLVATATDLAGNVLESPKTYVTIDTIGPDVSFISPSNDALLKSFGTISGQAITAGAPMSNVKLLLQRSDGLFWTGTTWASAGSLTTTYNSSTDVWSRASGFPSGANLLDGAYVLIANAVDSVGNLSTATCNLTIDNTAPQVSISQPQSDMTFTSLDAVSGDASDSGTGVSAVTLRLYRASGTSPAGYWNGTSWDATYNAALHEQAVTGTTAWTFALPPLEDGSYTLRATARDALGNSTVTSDVSFAIDSTVSSPLTDSSHSS